MAGSSVFRFPVMTSVWATTKLDKKDKLEHLAENKLEQHHYQASTT